jgi:hypothetical protein
MSDLVKQLEELWLEKPQKMTWAEMQEVTDKAANALEAQARRIAELEHTSKCHVEGFVKQCEIANKQANRIAELEAENAKLRTALKPFDEMLQRDFSIMADDERYDDDFTATVLMRLGDLRAARAAYLGEKND